MQRPISHKPPHHAGDAPDICARLVVGAKNDLGTAVLAGLNDLREMALLQREKEKQPLPSSPARHEGVCAQENTGAGAAHTTQQALPRSAILISTSL